MERWLWGLSRLPRRILALLTLFVVVAFALSACGGASAQAQATASAQTFTQQAGQYTVTMRIAPAKFGNNTFTASVANADGSPFTNGKLFIATTMVEMDMGTEIINLTPATHPGAYSGQGELTMVGHWRLDTNIHPTSGADASTTFTIDIGY